MFTGIIRGTGRIEHIERRGADWRMRVSSAALPWADYDTGESIAVNGVCLTAVALKDDGFMTDVSRETLEVTALGQLAEGALVNLEPAMSIGERLGGHLVSGHVDCVGSIAGREVDARSVRLEVRIPPEYGRYVARKGSVCVDGVSLTVNAVSADSFEVNIIPHTAAVTIAGQYRVGNAVNIEVDQLARYLERLLDAGAGNGMTKEFLREHGYA